METKSVRTDRNFDGSEILSLRPLILTKDGSDFNYVENNNRNLQNLHALRILKVSKNILPLYLRIQLFIPLYE